MIWGCEEPFIPQDVPAQNEYVVEGKIELSDLDMPAYVILSKSFSYYSDVDTSLLKNIYVNDAQVVLNDGTKNVELQNVKIFDLDPLTRLKILSEVGTKIYSPDFRLYIDKQNSLTKKEGIVYNLNIRNGKDTISAMTSIPKRVSLDSAFFKAPPGEPTDTLKLLWGRLNDPPATSNYYKYFIINTKKIGAGRGNTLYDDKFINGKSLDLPFSNLIYEEDEFKPGVSGYYHQGDTLIFKWCSMDENTYNFWQSFQFSNNQGPFSSYIRPSDNINNGLGNFGAYNCQVFFLVVP